MSVVESRQGSLVDVGTRRSQEVDNPANVCRHTQQGELGWRVVELGEGGASGRRGFCGGLELGAQRSPVQLHAEDLAGRLPAGARLDAAGCRDRARRPVGRDRGAAGLRADKARHALGSAACNSRACRLRQRGVEGVEVARRVGRRDEYLAIVHVPRVPDPPASLFHCLAPRRSAPQEHERAVRRAERVPLFRAPVASSPVPCR